MQTYEVKWRIRGRIYSQTVSAKTAYAAARECWDNILPLQWEQSTDEGAVWSTEAPEPGISRIWIYERKQP